MQSGISNGSCFHQKFSLHQNQLFYLWKRTGFNLNATGAQRLMWDFNWKDFKCFNLIAINIFPPIFFFNSACLITRLLLFLLFIEQFQQHTSKKAKITLYIIYPQGCELNRNCVTWFIAQYVSVVHVFLCHHMTEVLAQSFPVYQHLGCPRWTK